MVAGQVQSAEHFYRLRSDKGHGSCVLLVGGSY